MSSRPLAIRMTSGSSRRTPSRRLTTVVAFALVAPVLSAVISVATAAPAHAAATVLLADWEMNEASGATVMNDSSGNGINGSIGSAVQTGFFINGATGYHWTSTMPNQPPPKPERLVQVPNSSLNPGARDYAVTVRFRTTNSYGNMIQKGQATTPGGYFKWEIPSGQLMCLFRSRSQNGTLLGQKSVKSPLAMPLNDGAWHTVRCEKTVDRVTMTIDGTVVVRSSRGTIGSISNTKPLTIAGKLECDQVSVTCDYFAGDIDWVHIEASTTGSNDTTPPSAPGTPTGESHGFTTTDLSWPAATDDVSTTLRYLVFRDGQQVTTIASAAPVVSFTDTGLAPGSTHTYSVVAQDLAGNSGPPSQTSAQIQVVPAPQGIFVDDFSSGFSGWNTVTRMTLDNGAGNPFAPSAKGQPVSTTAFATKILPSTFSMLCTSFDVNAATLASGTTTVLARFKTSGNSGITRLLVDTNGFLRIRSDVSSITSPASSVALGTGGWHNVEMCGTVGSAGTWDIYRDGVQVLAGWTANTGTTAIGRLEIGDSTGNKTWSVNYDVVVVDQVPGTVI